MRFAHSGRRLSGLAFPLSALRSADSPGCGEYPDLKSAGSLARSWKLDLIQLLPVNDSGSQTSPYSALSAFALHPLYLRIADLPELGSAGPRGAAEPEAGPRTGAKAGGATLPPARADAFRAEAAAMVERFRDAERVPHEELLAAKIELLERIWESREKAAAGGSGKGKRGTKTVAAGEDPELDAWMGTKPWVRSYAVFVESKRRNEGKPWWDWSYLRDPSLEDIDRLWSDPSWVSSLRFWAWVQMRAAAQFRDAADYLAQSGIALMGDIPILMNKDSADVWARRQAFRLELVAGAPPDMYSYLGQNWGFPIYNWEALAETGYDFWIERLREADAYYSCYRIDHVLGFFRIWSLSDRESTGYLGRFVPDHSISRGELEALGFSAERLRWMSQPHIPEARLTAAAGEAAAHAAAHAALDRIGTEALFLFKSSIRGEKDIQAIPTLSPAARDFLVGAWRDRALFEFESDRYVVAWRFREASCWPSLSDGERAAVEALVAQKARSSEGLWAETGRRLLGALKEAVPMLPCAEDLGAVPDCVPRVLGELGILGLRVLRWTRRWDRQGQPYVPPAEYPELSVACPSVHDSSSLREWWESEAERERVWDLVAEGLGRSIGPCPAALGPDELFLVLELLARSRSRFVVYPLQDVIAMSEWRPEDPRAERINVPGTTGADNWRYRMAARIEELALDEDLAGRVRALVEARLRESLR
jgi:4-alpha-glucanotransferase